MRYFHTLRTEIEKEGLPGIMAELYDRRSGEAIGDVACGEDRHGIWVSGALRADAEVPTGIVDDASKTLGLRSFRLPDTPRSEERRVGKARVREGRSRLSP